VQFSESWFFVEQFEVRGASGLKQVHDSLCPRWEVRCLFGQSGLVEQGSGSGGACRHAQKGSSTKT
jgi:hypothetical protein